TGSPVILALGGGPFIDPETRVHLKAETTTVWLKADLQTLLERTQKRRSVRPLLMQDEPTVVLTRLIEERHPIYAEADLMLESGQNRLEDVVQSICRLVGYEDEP
ncbi:MAG: shikimate kinase, partial [Pseudomonadota bacterium]